MPATPVVPETITVHLGPPGSGARNVEVPFASYIKNVASHEIYPTWPENAIRANILAQISYALNRVYTEYYRTRGYDYDITNTTQYDQAYVEGGDVFENISQIVDDSFNNYIVRAAWSRCLPSSATGCGPSAGDCPSGAAWTWPRTA